MRRSAGGVDFSVYLQSLGLLVKNPALLAAPLLMAIIGVFVNEVIGGPNGGVLGAINSGIGGLVHFLLLAFGFGVSLIVAEQAWRRGKSSFDTAWDEARRKAGDILLAALGVNFVIFVAGYAGALIGPLGLILQAAAFFFLIYAIPAAAIGGIPGGATLQVSIERVRANPLPTALLCVVFLALLLYAGFFIGPILGAMLGPAGVLSPTIVVALINAIIQSIVLGYMALVVSKVYDDIAFRRPW